VLALILALAAIVSTQQGWIAIEAPGSFRQHAVITTDVLNLRAAPTTDADVLDTGAEGDHVEVIGSAENGFYPVRVNGTQGWMSTRYLQLDGESTGTQSQIVDQPGVALAADIPAQLTGDEPSPVRADSETSALEDPSYTSAVDQAVSEPQRPSGERWIEINRSRATVTLHHGDTVVAVYAGRIGRDPSPNGFYSTAVGTYYVFSMNKGLAPTPFAEDTYLTDWVGFDPVRKNGIHSPVRDANGIEKEWQNQTTMGCVRLSAADAVSVFEFAEIGMRVVVRE
jgi:lipoprotein-anchoring transpeptidase ErfK/SrfK